MIPEAKENIEMVWSKKIKDGLGQRHKKIQACYDMEPEQLVKE